MPSVRQKPSGRWEARYRGPDGRQHAATFRNKTEARRFLERNSADRQRGDWLDPQLAQTSFAHWADEWFATTVHLKPKTRVGYESMLRTHVRPFFGRRAVSTIVASDLRRLMSELAANDAAPGTIRSAFNVTRLVLNTALQSGAIRANPCAGIRQPRSSHREMRFLTPEQVEVLAHEIANPPIAVGGGEHRRPTYPELGLLIRVAAYTGLRAGELGAIRVRRVDPLHGTIHVAESLADVRGHVVFGPTKTYANRSVPVPRVLAQELGEHLATVGRDPDALVFTGPDGGPLRHQNFYRRFFKPAVARSGLPTSLRFHDLRHTYAALLIAQGAHPRAMMERLGHSSVTVTINTYGHLMPGLQEQLTEGLDAVYRGVRKAPSEEPAAALQRPLRTRKVRTNVV
jgi:integrase